jgi:hypothetical protein
VQQALRGPLGIATMPSRSAAVAFPTPAWISVILRPYRRPGLCRILDITFREYVSVVDKQLHQARKSLEETQKGPRRTLELTEKGQITERFRRAIDRLGNKSPEVCIGRIYALATRPSYRRTPCPAKGVEQEPQRAKGCLSPSTWAERAVRLPTITDTRGPRGSSPSPRSTQ